uniref:Uncharacterized protein n=1 Tax=Sphaerodactylus townsendi TaxID=933632 RepID=A0ACB8EFP8_9SAUR
MGISHNLRSMYDIQLTRAFKNANITDIYNNNPLKEETLCVRQTPHLEDMKQSLVRLTKDWSQFDTALVQIKNLQLSSVELLSQVSHVNKEQFDSGMRHTEDLIKDGTKNRTESCQVLFEAASTNQDIIKIDKEPMHIVPETDQQVADIDIDIRSARVLQKDFNFHGREKSWAQELRELCDPIMRGDIEKPTICSLVIGKEDPQSSFTSTVSLNESYYTHGYMNSAEEPIGPLRTSPTNENLVPKKDFAMKEMSVTQQTEIQNEEENSEVTAPHNISEQISERRLSIPISPLLSGKVAHHMLPIPLSPEICITNRISTEEGNQANQHSWQTEITTGQPPNPNTLEN